jgi:UDP:flavonoid glycosyltransferase YjiC (YdhE family)
LYRSIFRLIKKLTLSWVKPLYDLCVVHQLPAPAANPVFEGQYSPYGTLAMFPKILAQPQLDWPVNTMVTGFPLFSGENTDPEKISGGKTDPEIFLMLERFLHAGEPPLVFALGSSAVHIGQEFFQTSALVAKRLNRRAVLVTGPLAGSKIEESDDVFMVRFVAYDKLFPHASVIIHQGGIGTLAQAICAQKPMLIVPFGFDQFDNAERLMKLGTAEVIKRKDYTVKNAATLIEKLATEDSYKRNAFEVGTKIKNERGIDNACSVIESLLKTKG